MNDIMKVTEEEFDEEGNLTRRTITEYGRIKFASGGPVADTRIRVGDVWPYSGMITTPDPNKYQSYNRGAFHQSLDGPWLVDEYDHGTFARRTAGGTDKDKTGQVVG